MRTEDAVLLIGGGGFIGGALAKALAVQGREIHIVSRSAEPGLRAGAHYHRGGQDDPGLIASLLKRCGTLIHLASTTTPGVSARKPLREAQENLLPALQLIDTMAQSPPAKLVYISSGGALYGNARQRPVGETNNPDPMSYYAAGKASLEAFFTAFSHANEVPLAIVRPSNIYGPGQTMRGGFGVIRTLMQKALTGESFEVWGDINHTRDFLYIDDAIDAIIQLATHTHLSGCFNLGSGIETRLGDLIALVQQITASELKLVERPSRRTDVDAIVLDCTKLRDHTGWSAQTDLREGLKKTWDALTDRHR